MSYKIGIVGRGFVGNAVYENFKDKFEVKSFDLNPEKSDVGSIAELVNWAETLFVCVPTPSNDDGSCDIAMVESVVSMISFLDKTKIVVLKSTVPPGTTRRLSQQYGVKMAFNPEFLTEANSIADFKYQPLIVVGTDDEETETKVWQIYYKYVSDTGYMPNMMGAKTDEAEMFKYMANSFLATKVVFANEMKLLCDKAGIDYNNVSRIARTDRRLGHSHWQVPGPDGKLGYGGSCFPKDTNALVAFAASLGVDLWVLTDAMYANDEIRESKYFNRFEII
jgi:UDPglucose 6-dehydrogenase